MNFNQRTNHLPGIYNLAKKNMLGRHLMKIKRLLPDHYAFFPQTYMLPHDFREFSEDAMNLKKPATYIMKPDDSCQGKGIFLTRNIDQVKSTDAYVVQKYLTKPHLIDGYKYDLRIYVLINGVSPLRAYIYQDGLARFATEKYQKPNPKNMSNLFMHLTNYAINKESEKYVPNDNGEKNASKRSLRDIYDIIEA
mmetsp:Transcript_34641/g.52993  ORF Transcript_34641/g.52993 Transcript_34641/m.52993 type:complete len:194 (+) Transcript_34641:295-876(+)